ncbi:hypothetical protein, variant 2 [Aphanomyces astaci]|uniref:P-type ATPase A domain-containing protein n=1 Tax=Aphanomyces astaci TaxID=112090 RepID=W4H5H2_APHAT|nr:hypothetical protein, variant 2 [Aphanomyces astaci]ETV86383.1 hypothetical protein, variant 2 [Aphanomyces astaci]RQM23094.1 hypothetical protein B5M09_005694 [Aphanomyces astaci]|eukprot:XP_009824855.1 hypothetical protein, variant 2 [Aphanomyces astaci]
MGRISTSPRRATDEHLLDVAALEMRFQTDLVYGLTSAHVAELQAQPTYRPNLLPTDVETGHGAIHELVAVLREGTWIHTRAENLVPGDVISLKTGQCVPADVRLVEAEDMVVTHLTLTGEKTPLPRSATTVSVFDSPGVNLPYMQAANMLFYGTTITQGVGKGVVCRIGADTVLGVISNTVLQSQRTRDPSPNTKLYDDVRTLGVACKNEQVPACLSKITALVVEHSCVVQRTVVTASFGADLPVTVTAADAGLHPAEASTDDVELAIATTIMDTYKANSDANALMRAFSACHSHPSLNSRDQAAISRFCDLFTGTSRYAASLCGQLSGCDVYVHFDPECSAHVVVLQGPAREVLSRCGQVRKGQGVVVLDTADFTNIERMLESLEARGEDVVGVAELYLDPVEFPPVGNIALDMAQFNFPTSNMIYLGALGLQDKASPDLVHLVTHCHAADVSVFVLAEESEFVVDGSSFVSTVLAAPSRQYHRRRSSSVDATPTSSDFPVDSHASTRFVPLSNVQLGVQDATAAMMDLSPLVVAASAISISNTFGDWKHILMEHPVVVFEGTSPAHIDLLVETLQDLGEVVGLIASGNANALSHLNADVGFAIPTGNIIDLSEEAADVVLGYSESPRVDAVRIIELAKRAATATSTDGLGGDGAARARDSGPSLGTFVPEGPHGEAKHLIENLLRDTIAVGRALQLSPDEMEECFHVAMGNMVDGTHEYV